MLLEDDTHDTIYLEGLKKQIEDLHLEIRYIAHLAESLARSIKSLIEVEE